MIFLAGRVVGKVVLFVEYYDFMFICFSELENVFEFEIVEPIEFDFVELFCRNILKLLI